MDDEVKDVKEEDVEEGELREVEVEVEVDEGTCREYAGISGTLLLRIRGRTPWKVE